MEIKNLFVLLLAGALILTTGCATTVKLSEDSRKNMGSVDIKKEVSIPEKAYFKGRGGELSKGFTGLLIIGMQHSEKSNEEKIAIYVRENGIALDQMVREEFTRQLRKNPLFGRKIVNQDGQASFVLDVEMFGLEIAHVLSSEYKPAIRIKGKLVDSSGKVLWENFSIIDYTSKGMEGAKLEDYFGDPKVMKAAFQAAIQAAVAELMEKLG